MLQLKDIKKSYHRQLVLDIPFLQLEKGIYWIKGANGSGKSTLLKMIAGLIPFDGDIRFRDASLREQPLAYRQQVSWAAAEPLFPPFMTGMDLIRLYQQIRQAPENETAPLIAQLQMSDIVNSPVSDYSSGMAKKLSLVLAFIGNPSLVILDEPLTTLDAPAFAAVSDIILEKNEQHGTTFLMSSHQDPDRRLLFPGKELTVVNRSVLN